MVVSAYTDHGSAPVSSVADPAHVGATLEFAGHVLAAAEDDLPTCVLSAATRSMVNALGLAVAAGAHPDIDRLTQARRRAGEGGDTPLPGRGDTLGPLAAATVVGTAAHFEDFDDTHLSTVIHSGPTIFAALWALETSGLTDLKGSKEELSKRQMTAAALGVEAQLRIGTAMSPEHYDAGWHITGTCGVFGAATVASVLFEFAPVDLAMTWGMAASMTVGHREAFGTIVKPFHAGQAAANGVLAGVLRREGLEASARVLEAPRGFFGVLAGGAWRPESLGPLQDRWLIEDVAFKAAPCGVVAAPAIEAASEVSVRVRSEGVDAVRAIRVRCHPLVVELMGNPRPSTGLDAKFSAAHVVAAALVFGHVGLDEVSDLSVEDPTLVALREKVSLEPDGIVARESAEVVVELVDGTRVAQWVEVAMGSATRPLDDAALEAKFRRLTEPVLGSSRSDALLEKAWQLGRGTTIADLVPLARTDRVRP